MQVLLASDVRACSSRHRPIPQRHGRSGTYRARTLETRAPPISKSPSLRMRGQRRMPETTGTTLELNLEC
jgi:hypothetical protein